MGASGSTQIHSPRHSVLGGRLRVDSPSASRRGSERRLSAALLNSPAGDGITRRSMRRLSGSGGGPATEKTPLTKGLGEGSPERKLGDAASTSPPLAVWIGPALACAMCYALYNIFIKKGSATINPILGGVILQFVAAFLGCVLLGFVIYLNKINNDPDEYDDDFEDPQTLQWDWTGVKWAILAGFAVGAAEIISFCVNGMGVQAMQSIPIIIGGSVMFGTVLGFLALGEELTARGWTGVILISLGICLVGMDDTGEVA